MSAGRAAPARAGTTVCTEMLLLVGKNKINLRPVKENWAKHDNSWSPCKGRITNDVAQSWTLAACLQKINIFPSFAEQQELFL